MKKKHIFCSERLGFRIWNDDDLAIYAKMNASSKVMKFFPPQFRPDYEGSKKSIEGFMKHYHDYGFTYFAVDLLEQSQFVGFIGMKTVTYQAFFTPGVDIGWRLSEEYWGRGLATEGARKCKDYFFDNFDYERLISLTPVQNIPSWKVMEKIGMEKLGYFDHPLLEEQDPLLNHVVYEIRKG